ncbi:potassium voltage-gated channel protein Shaw-like isoform X2 [Dreissena polymorpha]|uniref:potassium voltage-gated channel protein Shaw-like isoform X2 n=1 Tax=Dreissena polymorpha TaxID=45954 RepID=UPI002264E2D2|nr:potassium voltage-gated channel protein Shaw-like isoform X2 [Dreissena polymorpha]
MYLAIYRSSTKSIKLPDIDLSAMGTKGRECLTFNVGGVRFQTLRQTMNAAGSRTRLCNAEFLQAFYDEERGEYFFDRDPNMFLATLNYLRTGELHLPSFVCGPAAKIELEFWGVQQYKIEQCCWINYNEWNSAQDALKRLEHDRKVNLLPCDTRASSGLTFWQRWRPRVWRFMNRTNSSTGAKVFGYMSLLFVVLSIFSFMAETTHPFEYYTQHQVQITANQSNNSDEINVITSSNTSSTSQGDETDTQLTRTKHPALKIIDIICLSYFIIEYVARLTFSPKKLKHATSLLAVIDLLAILPDLIETIIYNAKPELKESVEAVGYITIIRVVRVLRIFRLVRHSAGLWILIYTLKASFSEFMLLFWFMTLGILVFSSLVYFVDDQTTFVSIPAGFWWALITMTTVGYGDMYPVTVLGKIVGSFCAMAGVLMIGFTVPSLVNNFMLYYRHIQFAMHMDKFEKEYKAAQEDKRKFAETNGQCNSENIDSVNYMGNVFLKENAQATDHDKIKGNDINHVKTTTKSKEEEALLQTGVNTELNVLTE